MDDAVKTIKAMISAITEVENYRAKLVQMGFTTKESQEIVNFYIKDKINMEEQQHG